MNTATRTDRRAAEAARARALARLRRTYPFNPTTHPLGHVGEPKHETDLAAMVAEVDAALVGDHVVSGWHPAAIRRTAAGLVGCPEAEVDDYLTADDRERLGL